jgi:phage shock protein E
MTSKRIYSGLKILIPFLTIPLITLLSSCHPLKPFTGIDTNDALKLMHSELIILDVRTPAEFATGCITGAVNLDFKSPEFAGKLDELDKTKTYLVYCRTGGRSAKAMVMMKEKGFQRIYNLKGGITKWMAKNLPIKTE